MAWPNHSASPPTALAKSIRADRAQTCCSRIQLSARDSTSYLADELEYAADFETRIRLRFASSPSSLSLNVRCTRRLSTVGDRAFPVAAARTWNSLPQHVTYGPHPLCLVFEVASRLFSSRVSSHDFYRTFCSDCAVTVVIFKHLNRSLYLLTYLARDYPSLQRALVAPDCTPWQCIKGSNTYVVTAIFTRSV